MNAGADSEGQAEAEVQEHLRQAKRLIRGRGTARNYEEAVEHFDAAARLGSAEALYWLGKCYMKGLGCTKDALGGTLCWERAAALGHAAACYKLGESFEEGIGAPHSAELAAYWYRRAVARGEERAYARLSALARKRR